MKKPRTQISVKIALISVATLGLSACVPHLSQQQCQSMNWYQVGYQDGSQGRNQRDLSSDIQDCARFKLTVNTGQYQKGWQVGVRQYCQPQTAYNMGVNGAPYNDICPSDLAGKFNQAYRSGLRKFCVPATGYNIGRAGQPMPNFCASDQVTAFRNAYASGYRVFSTTRDIQSQIDDINGQISDLNNQIQNRQNNIAAQQRKLVVNKNPQGQPYSPAERQLILMKIDQDRRDIRRMQRQIQDRQDQINQLRAQLTDVQSG